jgi:uncharacterized protein (TIGR02231 family)
VECVALIQQMTGEDWPGVQLTLSTATPGLSATGPGLGPLPITLVPDTAAQKPQDKEVYERVQHVRSRQSEAVAQSRRAVTLSDTISSSWGVNAAANELQTLELAAGKEVLRAAQEAEATAVDGPSLSYQLATPVRLESRADQQMVRVFRSMFKSTFYYLATPVLTTAVYREAELVNDSPQDLLAGPISVYLEGQFVGRSEIPTVAQGQTFVVGFGADPQLRTRRELADRGEVVQGGNRELSFRYRLVVESFKEESVPLRLFDRLPHSERPAEVRIKLGELKDPLSADKVYLRVERPKGILRWDIEVPGKAMADKARIVEYAFTIDFDRNLAIKLWRTPAPGDGAPGASPAEFDMKQEFEQMQRAKMAK